LTSSLADAPPDVRDFLDRVFETLPAAGRGARGYQFWHWPRDGKPTDEAFGLKAIPGIEPDALISRVMDVDAYAGHIAHVEDCRARQDPELGQPGTVRFFQVIRVPGVAKVQHELVLVDAGMVRGYRVAYWYLRRDDTRALDPKVAARSDFNIGAWLAAPGVVGYALSTWPRRSDVSALQWVSLTTGANVLARRIVEGNIDGMAALASGHRDPAP
jgi:hypothetical protein